MSRTRLLPDVQTAVLLVVGSILLASPAGLLWSALAPRFGVTVSASGLSSGDLESSKAFIGADGSFFLVMLLAGALCGVVGWWLFRQAGPVTVLALVVGGIAAGLIAATVGLMPGAHTAVAALTEGSAYRGHVDLYLGRLDEHHDLSMRATWAFLAWPGGACLAFFAAGVRRPAPAPWPGPR